MQRSNVVTLGLPAIMLIVALLVPRAVVSQSAPTSLIADTVRYDRDSNVLIASGHVEVLYDGRKLQASEVIYDAERNTVSAKGPIRLTDEAGSILLADGAELDADLQNGLIEGARLLLDERLQITAAALRRSGGRYNALDRVLASTCEVCSGEPRPTWAIRAEQVVQDEAKKRIHFKNATFEIFGVPVAYLPRMSIPDPRVRRATGFLLPKYRQSNIFGVGVKLPYYWAISPSSDLTITPFVTTKGTFILEGEYRRKIVSGEYEISGALAVKDGLGDKGRGYIATTGHFALPRGYGTDFDINLVSDDSFLSQFNYSETDRLTSVVRLFDHQQDRRLTISAIGFQGLRDDEDRETIPFIFPEIEYLRRINLPILPGEVMLSANGMAIFRNSGRNVLRAGTGAHWHKEWLLPRGILADFQLGGDVNLYSTRRSDTDPDGLRARFTPVAAAELSWPLIRSAATTSTVLEPVVQLVYSREIGSDNTPNEDSQLPEVGAGNLFSLNRYPGHDGAEDGFRANLGLRYSWENTDGWSLDGAFGRIVRANAETDFATGTGLSGKWSDYVSDLSFGLGDRLSFNNRALFSDKLQFRRNESQLRYATRITEISATHTYLARDSSNPIIGPQPETQELALEARYRFKPNWEIRGLWRYDVVSRSSLKAKGGLTYGNECAEFDLSISRRYTSSDNVAPSTSVSFGIKFPGLGSSQTARWPRRDCARMGI